MDYRKAFKLMMEEMGIKGVNLARVSRVQERQISSLINGKDVRTETFFKLLEAAEELCPGAMTCFCSHMTSVTVIPSPENLVGQMNSVQISRFLQAIATKINEDNGKSTEVNPAPILLQSA